MERIGRQALPAPTGRPERAPNSRSRATSRSRFTSGARPALAGVARSRQPSAVKGVKELIAHHREASSKWGRRRLAMRLSHGAIHHTGSHYRLYDPDGYECEGV